jgi:2-octaprenyl-6-methoxyphenol hydroxylase
MHQNFKPRQHLIVVHLASERRMRVNQPATSSTGARTLTAPYDILIAGGGFAGLALARALSVSLHGEMRVAVIERHSLPSAVSTAAKPDGRAVTLSAASVRLLSALGVWPRIAAQALAITDIDITDTALEATVRLPVLSYHNRLEGDEAASWVIETVYLRDALLAAARVSPGVTLLEGSAIARFTADANAIRVTLTNGTELKAVLLVAADGRTSSIREKSGIKSVGWGHDQIGIITTVAHEQPHGGRATQHFLPAGPFAILPLTGTSDAFPEGGRSCVTWSENADRGTVLMGLDDAAFLAELEARFGTRLGNLALDGPRSSTPLDTHLARSYVAQRIALIGDAAHTVHPIAGQGLNLALRDIAALTEVIADAGRLGLDIGVGEPLERYERWRRFDSTVSAAGMDALNRLFSNDWVLARTIRDAGAGMIDRLPGLKSILVRQAAGVAGDMPKLLQGRLA